VFNSACGFLGSIEKCSAARKETVITTNYECFSYPTQTAEAFAAAIELTVIPLFGIGGAGTALAVRELAVRQ
jgi:fructose-specific phosphotransferase system IIC component